MKVLHLPTAVGGNAFGLAEAEKQLGIESRVLIAEHFRYAQRGDIHLDLDSSQSLPKRLGKLAKTFFKIRSKFDAFHFNFGQSLINFPSLRWMSVDLPFYPDNAKLFVTYNGSDARQRLIRKDADIKGEGHNQGIYKNILKDADQDPRRRSAIMKMARHAKHMWALNPDLLWFLPEDKSSFLPYTIAGWNELKQHSHSFDGKALKVIHAPTHRGFKGTDHIQEAVNRLTEKHPGCVEFSLMEGRTHPELMAQMQKADLVVDQVMIGWYGATAVEAMKMGKPVIARIAERDLRFLPPRMAEDVREAFINADPFNLHAVLKKCVENRKYLQEKARAGLEYVHKWHDPVYVAKLTKEKYEM